MNTPTRSVALWVGAVMVATAGIHGIANAGAKGGPDTLGQPSAKGRVVVGTVPGHGNGRQQRARRGHSYGITTAQPQSLGPRNYYFEQGTGQGANMPTVQSNYFRARTNRNANPARRGRHHHAPQVNTHRGLTAVQVRVLLDQLPPRRRNNQIDPRSQAAPRDSSGISFGPQGSAMVDALSSRSRKVVPASQGYRQGKPRFANESDLPRFEMTSHGGGQYIFAQGTWFVPHNGRLHPAIPPVGLTVPRLPNGYSSVNRGGNEYFTADGVYLRRFAGGYVVVAAPANDESVPSGS